MIEFKVGKYYILNYKKALESFDFKRWPSFANELSPFLNGPKKCLIARRINRPVCDEENHQFCYHLSFEGGDGNWHYTESLLSCFKEKECFLQEEMDI